MIQRIQSVYLFAVAVLMTLMFFNPLVSLINKAGVGYYLKAFMFTDLDNVMVKDTSYIYPLGGLIAIIAIASFVNIFLYKKRKLQIRLSIYNMILLVVLVGLIAFYTYLGMAENDVTVHIKISATFPIISLVLMYLAFRNIRKDDALVKSLNRIR